MGTAISLMFGRQWPERELSSRNPPTEARRTLGPLSAADGASLYLLAPLVFDVAGATAFRANLFAAGQGLAILPVPSQTGQSFSGFTM